MPKAVLAVWIYPGHCFKYGKQGWTSRLNVTEHSTRMCFERTLGVWEKQQRILRRKMAKKDLEEAAEMSSLVEALYQDVCRCYSQPASLPASSPIILFFLMLQPSRPQYFYPACPCLCSHQEAIRTTPLKPDDVNDQLCGPYRQSSDDHLTLELSSILQEKPEKLNLESVTILKEMLLAHTKTHAQNPGTIRMVQDLETDSYQIVETSIQHDVKAITIHLEKTATYEASKYWAKLEKDNTIVKHLKESVKAFLDRYVMIVPVVGGSDGEDQAASQHKLLKAFLEFKRSILNKPHHKMGPQHLVAGIA